MDSGCESELSSIKLRKYAKRAIIGKLIMKDGSIQEVPAFDEENDRVIKILGEIIKIEKRLGQPALNLRLALK